MTNYHHIAGLLAIVAAVLTLSCNGTKTLARRAANGDKAAQFEYGRRLLTGKCAPHAPQRAVCWFKVAAQQGHAGAEAALGVCYERGIGVHADISQARQWYQRAFRQGHPHALLALARLELREKRPNEAVRLLEAGSKEGLLPAQLTLACLYMGNSGVQENPGKAVDNIRYAAMGGSGEAAYLMFLCYAEGYGVPPEPSLAYGWLANAAELGHQPSRKILSSLGRN